MTAPLTRDAALLAALKTLGVRWPRRFAPATLPDLLPIWDRATTACPFAALLPAAQQLAADWGDYPPKPSDLAAYAKTWAAKHMPDAATLLPPPEAPAPETEVVDRKRAQGERLDAMGHRAYAALGSWRAVGEVWALLAERAPSDAERVHVQFGEITDQTFDLALAAYQRGVRPRQRGPLAAGLTATPDATPDAA